MTIQEELYQAMETIVARYFQQAKISKQVAGVVLGTSGKNDGKYIVKMNGQNYTVKDGVNINPSVNSAVWVCVPNGDYNQAYICAKK